MALRTPARKSGAYSQGTLPPSPCGATPRPHLRQVYPKPPQGSYLSEYELNESLDGNYSSVKKSTKVTTYTSLRPQADERRDVVDAPIIEAVESGSSSKSFFILGLIFLLSLVALGVVYVGFPKLENDEYQHIKVPKNIEDAKDLGRVLSRYKERYYFKVLFAFIVTYIFLQTFAIPGSIFLSIISGFLYPVYVAIPVVCLCSGIGASLCYLLSYVFGRPLVQKFWPDRVSSWSKHVDRHRDHLFFYMLFLRITPFLPNWFINITSPVISVPLWIFFFGTVLGVCPPSVIMIQAGQGLYKLTSYGETFTYGYFFWMAFFAILSILPVLFRRKLREKFD